jgi:hypothetical protein
MPHWHFIIPFFLGKNAFVHPKGGAPPSRKINYLTKTTDSVVRHFPDIYRDDIHIFVCDDVSEAAARDLSFGVHRLHCPPQELPYRTLCEAAALNISADDVLCFTEDDQVFYLADTVRKDIEDCKEDLVFSPHRWARTLLGLRTRKRPRMKLNGVNGVLDNIEIKSATPRTRRFRHTYDVQDTRNGAYAACWAMKFSGFRKIDLELRQPPGLWLELPSFLVYEQIPVLKLSIRAGEDPAAFIVDHLSGYDYNKRVF